MWGGLYNMRSYIKVRQVENHWYRLIRLREAEREERQRSLLWAWYSA